MCPGLVQTFANDFLKVSYCLPLSLPCLSTHDAKLIERHEGSRQSWLLAFKSCYDDNNNNNIVDQLVCA